MDTVEFEATTLASGHLRGSVASDMGSEPLASRSKGSWASRAWQSGLML